MMERTVKRGRKDGTPILLCERVLAQLARQLQEGAEREVAGAVAVDLVQESLSGMPREQVAQPTYRLQGCCTAQRPFRGEAPKGTLHLLNLGAWEALPRTVDFQETPDPRGANSTAAARADRG